MDNTEYTEEQAEADLKAYMEKQGIKGTCKIGDALSFGEGSAYHATITRESGDTHKYFVFSTGSVVSDTDA